MTRLCSARMPRSATLEETSFHRPSLFFLIIWLKVSIITTYLFDLEARGKFLNGNPVSLRSILAKINDAHQAREWLVGNVKSIGYKEAGHFLRNIGFEQDLAILDRHILKNLKKLGVIDTVPESPTKRQYLATEAKMKACSQAVHIPMSHLDFVLWYKETGEILK